jgi:hypothetical protein
MRRGAPLTLLAVGLVGIAGCRGATDSPRGAIEAFLDAHYVRMDLEAAKQHTAGVARFKVEEEQRLVGDQKIDASTRRPRVTYKLVEPREEADDHVALLYEAKIHFDDGGDTALRWLVSARRETDGTWKVSNYQEFE